MESAISGQSRNLVRVPNRGGTGTTWVEAKWYRYQSKWYRYHLGRGKMVPVPIKVVPVPLTKTKLVPVPIQVVLVPMLPTAPIFVFLHC